MVEPIENVSPSTSLQCKTFSNLYEGSDLSQGSTIYQLEMADAMESMMDLTNEVQKQDQQNAEESGQSNSTVTSF